ncbi:uncharacterized protein LOC141703938 [Apium graveolens]|uniref:uncharacterized protein LOC141703938 n=1 Tax=Apium graveolens TaxID=4045 RepID=UPI003D79CA41
MTNLTNLSFVALDISGENYLSWVQDVKLHLGSKKLGNTIKAENTSTIEENFTSIIFLRHHMHEDLKSEYLEVEDPFILWENLKDRFDHQKLVYLPAAENDWANLRVQDFKSVRAYSSALFKISSRLIMCGEIVTEKRKIDKTLSTFHPNNINLAEMYRERKFTKFGDLLSTLLVAEQNHELVIKNHQSRPTGSAPLPEVNNTTFQQNVRGKGHRGGRGHGRYRGRGRGRGHFRPYYSFGHQKWQPETQSKRKAPQGGKTNNLCHKCGMEGHWSRNCYIPQHLVDLYQSSKRSKGEMMETNFANNLDDSLIISTGGISVNGPNETNETPMWEAED